MTLIDTTLAPAAVVPASAPRSMSDRLHVLAFGAIGWPWLLRSLSGGPRRERDALLARLGLPPGALPNLGSWRADSGYLAIIAEEIAALRPATVIELGAGTSSLIAARALQQNGGGRLISLDHHAEFARATQAALDRHGLAAEVLTAALTRPPGDWPGRWYDIAALRLAPATPIDLLLIDGPPWAIHPYVRGAAESLFDRIAVGGVVLLDDAARPGERVVARRWRRRWPGFEFRLVSRGSKGTLIGRRLA